jgi:archaellum component FlaC
MKALEMERPMTEWNDDRLDELNGRVNDGFAKVAEHFIRLEGEMKEGFAKLDGEMNRRFGEVDKRFEGIDKRFEGIDKRFDKIDHRFEHFEQRLDRVLNTLLAAALGFGGTVLVAVLGLIASQV